MNLLKKSNPQQLIKLSKVNLVFELSRTSSDSLKDVFIKVLKNPIDFIFSNNDVFHCLKNVSFSINEGDRIALLGRNGSGKTSLCHLITGNLKPTLGAVERSCQVRSVYSTTAQLFPELSGIENAKVVARLLYPHLSEQELITIVDEAILFSELDTFSNAPIKTYSKGMSARLILSLVTALPADLLIMDELFDGADQFFMEKFEPRLKHIIEKSKATLFINHDISFLKEHCNQVIVLNEGEISYTGSPIKGFFYYQNKNWPEKRGHL